MSHPDLDRLTAWTHGLLDSDAARETGRHVASCDACGARADRVRAEGEALARALAPPAGLRERLLRRAGVRPSRGLAWQVPLAAAVLLGLLAVFLFPRPGHRLETGRLALEKGGDLAAPAELRADRAWRLRAVEKARLRLSDRSTLEAAAGTRIDLEPARAGGARAELSEGEVVVVATSGREKLRVASTAGRVETGDGSFRMRILCEDGGTPMKGIAAGVWVTVLAGSVSVSNAVGSADLARGDSAALVAGAPPLPVASSQDADALLRRLEQLVAAIARLEDEIARLEARNKQLKDQLEAAPSSNRVFLGGAGGAAPGRSFRLVEPPEKK